MNPPREIYLEIIMRLYQCRAQDQATLQYKMPESFREQGTPPEEQERLFEMVKGFIAKTTESIEWCETNWKDCDND